MAKLRPYQKSAKDKILKQLPNKPCLLGFCTGGGKTFTTHEIIKDWIKQNPNKIHDYFAVDSKDDSRVLIVNGDDLRTVYHYTNILLTG